MNKHTRSGYLLGSTCSVVLHRQSDISRKSDMEWNYSKGKWVFNWSTERGAFPLQHPWRTCRLSPENHYTTTLPNVLWEWGASKKLHYLIVISASLLHVVVSLTEIHTILVHFTKMCVPKLSILWRLMNARPHWSALFALLVVIWQRYRPMPTFCIETYNIGTLF